MTGVIISVVFLTIIIALSIWGNVSTMHRWKYRNPYARRCQKCGRYELFIIGMYGSGWEQHYPMPHTRDAPCAEPDDE